MKIRKFIALLFGSIVCLQTAQGGILGVDSNSANIITSTPSAYSDVSALFAIGPPASVCFVVGECAQIALLQGIDSSSIGTTIQINSGTPGFASVVSSLTNGVLDQIYVGLVPGSSYGTTSGEANESPETDFGTSPDFAGDTIQLIDLEIDNLTVQPFTVPGAPPSNGTRFVLDYTITVEGTDPVPEPSSGLAAGLGIVLLLGLKGARSTSGVLRRTR